MAYKITGILTLYKVTTENVIHVAINGDIKSPDGKNLFFKFGKDGNCVDAKIVEVSKDFTIPDKLEHVISLIFSNKQKATFFVDDELKNIEGVEIKQS